MPPFHARQALAIPLIIVAANACGGAVEGVSASGTGPQDNTPTPVASPSELPAETNRDPNDVWLAFDTWAPAAQIYLMRADGSDVHKFELGMEASAPAFSRNGKALAYAGSGGIWVRDLTTGTSSRVTAGSDTVPAWSPDGTLLAFNRGLDIYTVRANGTGEQRTIQGPPPGGAWYDNYGHPAFTRDGASLIFDTKKNILIGGVDGSGIHELFASRGMVAPAPESELLAINADCALVTVALADASDACKVGKVLEDHGIGFTRPAWSSNGLIAYASGPYEIRVVKAQGGSPTTVLDTRQGLGGAYVEEVSWSPPGAVPR